MIASMMAEREQELEIPEQNVSQAAKWINNDNPDNVSIETRKDKVNIVNNNRDNTSKEKKVSFKDTNNDTNNDIVTNILDKLKTKTNTQSTIEANTIDSSGNYRNTQDYFSDFVNDKVKLSKGDKIKETSLYETFKGWYQLHHGKKIPKGRDLFDYMNKRFGKKVRGVWENVSIIYNDYEYNDYDPDLDNAMSQNINTSTSTNTNTITIESRLDKLENMLYDFTNCQKNIEKMCVKILELHSTKNT